MCMLATLPMLAQVRSVTGTVVDAQGEPVMGATVRVDGTKTATVTDMDGVFKISADPKQKIRISFIGCKDAVVSASNTSLKVTMEEDRNVMDEVVVVGYGTQKKATLTGAVSAITNKEMTVTKNESVVNMLSGKIPGVRITQSSSQPGAYDNKIDIRGMGDPLIVVDGIPRDKNYFSRMDANEIESVSVLKDGSAAIYGVRAANGVILVTSKHGEKAKDGKFDITLSANYGWQNFLYVPQTADAMTHMLLYTEKEWNVFNDNYMQRKPNTRYTYDDMFAYSTGKRKSTNWTKEMFKDNVPQQQYNISMNGGSDKVTYFFNIGYLKQEGSYRSGSLNYDRWNFRSNVDAQITKRLKANVQLSGYMDEKNEPFTDIWMVYKKAWTNRPSCEAWLNGDHSMPAFDKEMMDSENPVAVIDSDLTGYRRNKNNSFNGALTLTYDIPGVKGLNAKAFYSYDYSQTNNQHYKRAYSLYSQNADGSLNTFARNTDSYLLRRTDPSWGTVMQLSLNYANTFLEKHNVTAMVLFEEQYNNWDNFYAQRNMLLDGEYLIYGENEGQVGTADKGGIGDKTRQAVVGRLTYDYMGKYMVDFAFRNDASSSFPKGSRWGFFPSVSLGWRASEEKFIKDLVPFMTNLKFRASYGEMGDDGGAGTYPATVVGYEFNQNQLGWLYDGKLVAGLQPTAVPNLNLTWYKAKTYNVGLDFDLWNGMLSGTFELFKRKRSGLLATSSAIVPGHVGASLPQENIESDQTFGWEFSLGHRNRIGQVNYWANAQISATKNRWDYHLDTPAQNSMENWRRVNVSGRNKDIWFEKEEGGRFTNYEQIRWHNTPVGQGALPGDYWYEDWNGDGVVNGDDYHPVASYNLPVFNFGINLGADWKGFDLSMNWQGSAGVYNQYDEVFTEVCPFNGGAALDIYTDRWHTANVTDDPWNPHTQWIEGIYPATGHSFNEGTTGIKNTSYLRLKTLEIGYTLPKVWLKSAGIKDVRVYVNAYNLLTITGLDNIDPERPGRKGGANNNDSQGVLFYNYPVNRTINVGATVKF